MSPAGTVSVQVECRLFGLFAPGGREKLQQLARTSPEGGGAPGGPSAPVVVPPGAPAPAGGSDPLKGAGRPPTGRVYGTEIGRVPGVATNPRGEKARVMALGTQGVCQDTYQAWTTDPVVLHLSDDDWFTPAKWAGLREAFETLNGWLQARSEVFESPTVSLWSIKTRPTGGTSFPRHPIDTPERLDQFCRAISGTDSPVIAAASQTRDSVAVKKLGVGQEQYVIVEPQESRTHLVPQLYTLYQVEQDLSELLKVLEEEGPAFEEKTRVALEINYPPDESWRRLMRRVDEMLDAQHILAAGDHRLLELSVLERAIDAYRGRGLRAMFRAPRSGTNFLTDRTLVQEEEETLESHYVAPVRRRLKSLEDDHGRAHAHLSTMISIFRGRADVRIAQRLAYIQWTLIALGVAGTVLTILDLALVVK